MDKVSSLMGVEVNCQLVKRDLRVIRESLQEDDKAAVLNQLEQMEKSINYLILEAGQGHLLDIDDELLRLFDTTECKTVVENLKQILSIN